LVQKLQYKIRSVAVNYNISIALHLLRLASLNMLISRTFVICSGVTNIVDYKIYETKQGANDEINLVDIPITLYSALHSVDRKPHIRDSSYMFKCLIFEINSVLVLPFVQILRRPYIYISNLAALR
jgi:hypothetical protein